MLAFGAPALLGCTVSGGPEEQERPGNTDGTDAEGSGGDASAGTGGSPGDGGTSPGTGGGPDTGAGGTGGGSDTGTGGTSGDSDCTANPSGAFVLDGDTVFDERTCLTWMQADVQGHGYFDAEAYCESLSLGGYDDWRLPTAGEIVSIFKCDGTYPPVVEVFTAGGDGLWTTTESGTIAGDEAKVCGAGQNSGQFYDFGKVGAQNTRCVRGAVTLPDRTDCLANNQICP